MADSRDGRTFLTGSVDTTAQLWDVPLPVAGESDSKRPHLLLSVEVRTGMELVESSGTIRQLTQGEWLEKHQTLRDLGGPIDVLPRNYNFVSAKK